MKQHQKHPLVAALLVLLSLVLLGCNQNPNVAAQQESAPALQEPETGSAADIVAAEGVVVPNRDADLSFRTSGQVIEILVIEGDLVSKGQELVKLDTRDLEQMLLEAKAGLKSAQAQRDKLVAGARPEEIASAKASLAIATTGVTAAEESVNISEGNLESAKADLAVAEGAVQVAEGTVASAQASVRSAQANLNKVTKGATQIRRTIAQKQIEQAKNELYGLQKQRDVTRNAMEGQIAAAEVAVQIAELLSQDIEAGPQDEDIEIARAQVSEAQAGVQTARAQLQQTQAQGLQATAGVAIAEAQLAQIKSEVESAKAQQQQAQAQLDLVEAGSRIEDIAVAEATVTQAETRLAAATNAMNDAVLKAPFEGTIGLIDIDEGELISAQIPVMRLGDLSRFQIETEDLSEVDVNAVNIGQSANITVDALDGQLFQGIVTQVAPTATDRRGDKVYAVLVDIDEGPEAGLKWGMSTFVEIFVR